MDSLLQAFGMLVMKKGKFWHQNNKLIVFNLFGGNCYKCDKNILIDDGCIHHLSYSNINNLSVYDESHSINELIDKKIIAWICKSCHRKIHETEQIGTSKIRYECHICGNSKGLIERAKHIDYDKPLCQLCFRQMRDNKELPKKQLNLFS